MNERQINLNTFNMLSVIGKGSYAKVVLVKKRGQDNKLYAMKILKKKYIQKRKQQGQVMIQRNILTKIDHPSIVKMYHSFQDSSKLYFILEFCPGGQLFNLLQKKIKFSEEQTKFFSAQIVLALEYLHNLDIVYRDLKPQNVLIDKYGYIRLTDFGLSNMSKCTQESKEICGTPQYIAPEMLRKQGHGKAIDWWCLGCLICQMLMGIPPFYCKSIKELFRRIKEEEPTFPQASVELRNLLEGLFKKNPLQRLGSGKGAEEIKGHPWFETIDWSGLVNNTLKPPFIPVLRNDEDVANFAPEFTESNINSDTESLSPVRGENGKAYEGFSYDNSPTSDQMQGQQNNEFEMNMQIEQKETS